MFTPTYLGMMIQLDYFVSHALKSLTSVQCMARLTVFTIVNDIDFCYLLVGTFSPRKSGKVYCKLAFTWGNDPIWLIVFQLSWNHHQLVTYSLGFQCLKHLNTYSNHNKICRCSTGSWVSLLIRSALGKKTVIFWEVFLPIHLVRGPQ